VTVRFAPTSSPAQLALAGRLCAADPSLYMQTHLAENRAEVAGVRELFPEARSYLDVYAPRGPAPCAERLRARHLARGRRPRRARRGGAQIAHSPSSNLFLGSGLFGWRAGRGGGRRGLARDRRRRGTSLSMLRSMADAYKVQALAGERLTAWKALHAATRGAAEALGLGGEIGSLEPGAIADVCVWDPAVGAVAGRRHEVARTLHEPRLRLDDARRRPQSGRDVRGRSVDARSRFFAALRMTAQPLCHVRPLSS
jgi:guanine deaminase